MPAGPPVTPQEMEEALAREMPPDLRMAARMPGTVFVDFHNTEQLLTDMVEKGLISQDVYEDVMGKSRFSFKYSLPAKAAPSVIKGLGEKTNATPDLAMMSRAAGAKRIGDRIQTIMRHEVPGMDARELLEIIKDPLVQQELPFSAALEMLEVLTAKQHADGDIDDEQNKEMGEKLRGIKRLFDSLLKPDGDARAVEVAIVRRK